MSTTITSQTNDVTFSSGIWEELQWRGLVKDSTNPAELSALLNQSAITFFCGFDPTAPSLHLGNLVQLLTMRRLQLAGHRPLALVGGSTGLIGDPRPTAERVLNDKETVRQWVEKLQQQTARFLEKDGTNGVKHVNNLDWFGSLNAIDFLRDFGKFFRVGSMLKKDAVKSRLESDAGISFTEFSYQILQASDFLELFRKEQCLLQLGGSDQWGNLTSGVELVSKVENTTVHALVTPLITNSDGTKFGKSEGNAVWLDPSMTSPFKFFQFWLNTSDEDVIDRLKIFTFLSQEEILQLQQSVHFEPERRTAQKRLAIEVTSLVHGAAVAESIVKTSEVLFSSEDLRLLEKDILLAAVEELNEPIQVSVGDSLLDVLVRLGITSGLGEGRRLIKQGGLSVNNQKATNAAVRLSEADFLFNRVVVVRKGKKLLRAAQKAV